jgi:hypothetical protein
MGKSKQIAELQKDLLAMTEAHEQHDAESHRQIAVQAVVLGALFLLVKGNRRRVMVPKNILEKAKGVALDAAPDKDGNLVLTVRPTSAPPEVAE